MAKIAELRGLPEAELRQRLAQTRQELVTLRLKAKQGALEQPHQIRQMRREIARIFTVLREPAAGQRTS
jgi:large subunit ribosomal protein L29